jgi:guanine deaminase
MDRNGGPGAYVETIEQALANAESFITYVRRKNLPRLQPALTPRFLPTCTPALLRGLGQLAATHAVLVQSHIRESYDEEAFVRQLEEAQGGAVSEAELFDAASLLTSKVAFCC